MRNKLLIIVFGIFFIGLASAWADNGNPTQNVDGCNLLNTTGATYTLTGNVSSTGTCFTISNQNITLDCAGNWITYSTGGAINTYGVYTNQFNSTIKNCNILDGNWGSSQSTRYGIYFNTNDYSSIFNSYINTNKSLAVYLYNNANYNNLTLNTIISNATTALALSPSSNNILENINAISTTAFGIYLDGSTNNTLINVNATSNISYGLYLQFISNSTFLNVNSTSVTSKKDLYFMPNSAYDCNNTFTNVRDPEGKSIIYLTETSSNIDSVDSSMLILCNANFSNITNSNFTRGGIRLFHSHQNTLSNINASSNTEKTIYIYSSSKNNNFFNITSSSNSNYGITIDGSYNSFTNTNSTSNTNYGITLGGSNNIFNNINSSSNTQFGLYLLSTSNNSLNNVYASSNSSYAIRIFMGTNNTLNAIEAFSNSHYGIDLRSSSYNTISNSSITSNSYYGLIIYDATNNNISNNTITSNLNESVHLESSSKFNIISNNKFISGNGQNNLVNISSNSGFNRFYGNNFTDTASYYVQDLNGTNIYNTTLNGRGEGNIWHDIMNGSVDISGNISSTLNPSLYIGEYGAGYPYNSTNSFGKISGSVVDYAPLTNQFEGELPITCGVLSDAGTTYTLTQNVSSTGTCFNITAPNITLDCAGYWINYSTGGAANTFGIYTNQFNTTVKNCNVLDGNWTSSAPNSRYGIYFDGNDNSTLLNNFVNSSSSTAIYFYPDSDNNTISNITASSKYWEGMNLRGLNNIIYNINASSSFGRGFQLSDAYNNTLFNITGTSNSSDGVYLLYSSENSLFNITAISKSAHCFGLDGLMGSSNSNIIFNSTFKSLGNATELYIGSTSGFNLFYWNNFTNNSGYYVQDSNGTNIYNTTLNGRGEGNIWHNIMNGSVDISGNISSTLNPLLYLGQYGTGYPYNSTNSFGKINGNVVDYAPLTNQFEDRLSPTYNLVSHNSTYANYPTNFVINITDETALHTNGQYIFSTNNTGTWTNETGVNFAVTPQLVSVIKTLNSTVGTFVGYMWYLSDNAGNIKSTSVYALTTTEFPVVNPPSGGGGGGSTTQTQYNYQLGREFYEQGETFQMRRNNQIGFRHGEESHTFTLNSFNSDSCKITIQSDPIIATLEKDVAQSFDIEGDGVEDIEVTYEGVEGLNAQIVVRKIVEITGDSVIYTNAEGGEARETEETGTTHINTDNLGINVNPEKTKRTKHPFRTVLISLIVMGIIIVGLAMIGRNEKKKKDRYLNFFDN